MFAAEQGRKTMLEFLLDHGADPFQRDSVSAVHVGSTLVTRGY